MSEATAQYASKRFPNLLVGGIRFFVQHGFGGEDYAAETKPALSSALIDKGLLNRMRFLRSAEAFQGGNFVLANGAYREHAGARGLAVQDDRASSALGQAASELWTVQSKLIGKNEEQWRGWVYINGV